MQETWETLDNRAGVPKVTKMSHKKPRRSKREVKCAYCGRESISITQKGYMKPHVKPDGRPCLMIHVVPFELLKDNK